MPLPLISSSRGETSRRAGLLAEAKLGVVAPHAMQHDGELTGHGDTRPRHTARLGDPHASGPQGRPLAAAHEQRMGGLIESRAGKFVAAAADLALDVCLARLVARRREAKMRTDLP